MTYEIFKIVNLDILEDRHTNVRDYAIKKLLGLHFTTQ